MNTVAATDNGPGPLEPEATPLSQHRFDRGTFVVAGDVEVTTSPNGTPGRLIKLTRGKVLHIVTYSRENGLFLRNGEDNFYVPLDAAERILVRQQ